MDLKKLLFIILCFSFYILSAQDLIIPDSTSVKIINETEPEYPKELAIKQIKATITAELLVKADSTYEFIRFIDTLPELEPYAKKALEGYSFSPATRKNLPIDSKIIVSVSFPPKSYSITQKKETFDPVKLKKDLEQYIVNEKYHDNDSFFLNYYYPLQTHIKGNFFKKSIYKNDIFYEYSPFLNDNLVYQNYLPLYHYNYENGVNYLSIPEYSFAPTLIRAQMAMGENDIQYANISFKKDQLFGLNNLNIYSAFLAQNGQIPLISEKASNALISLNWKYNELTLKSKFLLINQDYSTRQINDYQFFKMAEDIITESSFDYQYSATYRFLYFGYRDKSQKIKTYNNDKLIYENKSLTLGLKDSLFYNKFDLSIQQNNDKIKRVFTNSLSTKDKNTLISLSQALDFPILTFNNNLLYYSDNKVTSLSGKALVALSSSVKSGINYAYQNDFTPNIFNSQYLKTYDSQQIALSLLFTNSLIDNESSLGIRKRYQSYKVIQENKQSEQYIFAELKNKITFSLFNQNIVISHLCEYQNTETLYYNSELLNKLKVVVEHPMPRNNKISAGFDYYFASDFLAPQTVWSYTYVINTFVKFNITNLFDLTISVNNLNNSESYLSEELIPYNFNANVSWYFLN